MALANVVAALRGAGARPEHVVSLVMFTTDMEGYRTSLAMSAAPTGPISAAIFRPWP